MNMFRVATRSTLAPAASAGTRPAAQILTVRYASHGAAESYESFNERYTQFFANAQDLFELQRGLNNCFAYDLVPSQSVVEEALRCARRVNDYSTAVRIYEGLKEKTENKTQYQQYLDETAILRKELGVVLKEEMYPSLKK